jgi:prepilin-type processing-associated H-X9-DG protein
MLLPALSKARAKARDISCVSQLHQIGLALFMYADDNNNRLPPCHDLNTEFMFGHLIYGYIGEQRVLVCPVTERRVYDPSDPVLWVLDAHFMTYGENAYLHGVKLNGNKAGNPVSTVLVGDMKNENDSLGVSYAADNTREWIPTTPLWDATIANSDILYTAADYPDSFGWRHGGNKQTNFVMLDGHTMSTPTVYHWNEAPCIRF